MTQVNIQKEMLDTLKERKLSRVSEAYLPDRK